MNTQLLIRILPVNGLLRQRDSKHMFDFPTSHGKVVVLSKGRLGKRRDTECGRFRCNDVRES